MAVIVMLSDPSASTEGAPACAVHLVKPFDLQDLARAIDAATRET